MLGVVQLPFQAFSRQVCGPEPLPQTLVRELDGTVTSKLDRLVLVFHCACAQWTAQWRGDQYTSHVSREIL